MLAENALHGIWRAITNGDCASVEENARALLAALKGREVSEPLLSDVALLARAPLHDEEENSAAGVLRAVLSEAWWQLHSGAPKRLTAAKAEVIHSYFELLRNAGSNARSDVWLSTCSAFESALAYTGYPAGDDLHLLLNETHDILARPECRSLDSASALLSLVVSAQCLREGLSPHPDLDPEWLVRALEQAFDEPSGCGLRLAAAELAVDALPAQRTMDMLECWCERASAEGRMSIGYNLLTWGNVLARTGMSTGVLRLGVRLCKDDEEAIAQAGRLLLPTLVERCVDLGERGQAPPSDKCGDKSATV